MNWLMTLDADTRKAVIALVGTIGAALITGLGAIIVALISKRKKEKKEEPMPITQTSSVNSGRQIVVQGDYNEYGSSVSAKDASEIAVNLFMANFPKLQEEAGKVAKERADEFCKELMKKLEKVDADNYSAFKEPDVQYVLYEAQKSYARFGTGEMLKMLTEMMSARISIGDETIMKVSIDKAIEIVPMLSAPQLDYLSLLFLCTRTKRESVKTLEQLKTHLDYLAEMFSQADFECFSYVNMLGCLQFSLHNTVENLAETYNFSKDEVEAICPQIIKETTCDYSTSYIGTVLAITNAQQKTELKMNMKTWIK